MLMAPPASDHEGRHRKKKRERRPPEALPRARGGKVHERAKRQNYGERPRSHPEGAGESIAPVARATEDKESRSKKDGHGDQADDAKLRGGRRPAVAAPG